ncbi:MAG: phenolphthiocerol/phthiocerol/phthiodiolone dimycocerosyl transferase [Solirubrobacteraceae bacterium]|nr:phenolphthiocerol/phthiocerol/phthiodiolone dimycocerosyl transferase [Solirubrobacteraceae bacterium]
MRLAWEMVGREVPGLGGTIRSSGGDYVFAARADRAGRLIHADGPPTGDELSAHLRLDELDCVAALELAPAGEDAHVVSLLFRHSIADGRHGIYAFSRFWELYTDLVGGNEAPATRDPMHACSLEAALDERTIPNAVARAPDVSSPPIYHGERDWDGKQLSGLCHGHLRLERSATDRLIGRCKADSTSLHGVISAAVILSLSESRADLREFDLTTILDVRPHIEPPMHPLGGTTILGYSTSKLDVVSNPDVVSIARIVLENLERDIRSGSAQASSVVNAELENAGATPTTLSNLGVVPTFAHPPGLRFTDFTAWNEMDITNPGSPHVLPVYGNMIVASSFGGRLRLDFFHGREMFPSDWTSAQVRQVQQILMTYTQTEATPAAIHERRGS